VVLLVEETTEKGVKCFFDVNIQDFVINAPIDLQLKKAGV
jgi:hypothetical protein